jgi:hypothetical protein
MIFKAYHAKVRVISLAGQFGLSAKNIRKFQVAALQAVVL